MLGAGRVAAPRVPWPAAAELEGASPTDPEAIVWLQHRRGTTDDVALLPLTELQPLSNGKDALAVASVDGETIVLSAGLNAGVSVGDVYFILAPHESAQRMGEATIGLVRVTDANPDRATARIEHASQPILAGQLATFMQASLGRPTQEATVLFAPLSPDAQQHRGLPPLAAALPAFQADFGLTNIGVRAWPTYTDPRGWDADARASDAVDLDGFGTLIFGDIAADGQFTLHTASWGNPPHPASLVGILPGGLPLGDIASFPDLPRQLAPSFLAAVLAMRGDHALAVYLLERVLATETLHEDVRYHLREHLAQRYQALGRILDGVALMSEDIHAAETGQLPFVELNARSIRGSLDSDAGLAAQYLEDAEGYLRLATLHLPPESLAYARLSVARALSRTGERERASTLLQQMLTDEAIRAEEDMLQRVMFQLAITLAVDDDPLAPVVAADLLGMLPAEASEDNAWIWLGAAEILQMSGDNLRAMQTASRAVRAVRDAASASLRAAVYNRAAAVFAAGEEIELAGEMLQEATVLFLETMQYDQAAESAGRLAFTLLQQANSAGGPGGANLFLRARDSMAVAGELSLRLADGPSAARLLLFSGVIELRLGGLPSARRFLDSAWSQAYGSGDLRALVDVAEQQLALASAERDPAAAAHWQERMRAFGGSLERPEVPDIEMLDPSL